MIIGLTGSYAAGKDSAADYLKNKGYVYYSLSDLLREELRKQSKPITRENLIKIGNAVRVEFGAGELAKRALAAIKAKGEQNSVIVSIRNPEEVKVLKQYPGFKLWYVDAPIKMRYERAKKRGRSDDFASFEEFVKMENTENSSDPNAQQLNKVAEMADHEIINDADKKTFYRDIDELLEEPPHQNKIEQ
jgi:dephospho-CoA kinase